MSCILRIVGKDFDVDAFILKSEIAPYKRFYKGDPKYQSKPDGAKLDNSGCIIELSNADFHNFAQQLKDATAYLTQHKEKFKLINNFPGIDYSILDFGLENDDIKFIQTYYLPNDLLKIVGELGLSIELSLYQSEKSE